MNFNFYHFNLEETEKHKLLLVDGNKAIVKICLIPEDKLNKFKLTTIRPFHLCGYVAIQKNKIPVAWYNDYDADVLQFLNIHGGITFIEEKDECIIFGLDCAHAGDESDDKYIDENYVMKLVEQMEQQILLFAEYYWLYKLLKFLKLKKLNKKLIQYICNQGEIDEELSFGAMLDMLGGSNKF